MKILILFGHPAFQNSYINKKLIEGIRDIPNVTFHDLYETYPEMDIDIDHEQALMEEHDIIIFQHPMFWYSSPAIFKEWQDLVLEHGWAYGSKGRALTGKYFLTAVTTGAPKSAFGAEGIQGHSVREFLAPFSQMARLCNMVPLPPFVVHGTHIVEEERNEQHRQNYHKLLMLLGEEKLNLEEARSVEYLNDII